MGKGDIMIVRGIHYGDFVMVDPDGGKYATDGTIVAARLGEEATIKTLTHDDGTVVLEPANPDERAIVVKPEDDFALLGVVCGVFRPMCDVEVKPSAAEPAQELAAGAVGAGRASVGLPRL